MNYLIDSNIFIYAGGSEDAIALPFLDSREDYWFSSVTRIEVLSNPNLSEELKQQFEIIFARGTEFSLEQAIVQKKIELRQNRKMSLGDAIIAATAIHHNMTLVTRNVDDFRHKEQEQQKKRLRWRLEIKKDFSDLQKQSESL